MLFLCLHSVAMCGVCQHGCSGGAREIEKEGGGACRRLRNLFISARAPPALVVGRGAARALSGAGAARRCDADVRGRCASPRGETRCIAPIASNTRAPSAARCPPCRRAPRASRRRAACLILPSSPILLRNGSNSLGDRNAPGSRAPTCLRQSPRRPRRPSLPARAPPTRGALRARCRRASQRASRPASARVGGASRWPRSRARCACARRPRGPVRAARTPPLSARAPLRRRAPRA